MKVQSTNSGQALVLVLLSLAVVLTLVLFILSRTVTDVSVSSRNEEAARAFSAAEAGIEQALVIGTGGSGAFGNNAAFSSNVTNFAQGSYDFNYPVEMFSGDTFTTWFVAHDANGDFICDATHLCFSGSSLKVCWGKPGTPAGSATTPAIELSVFYESTPGSPATAKIARAAFDPNSSRTSSNLFSLPDAGACTINGQNYEFQKTIQFSGLGIPAASYGSANGLQFAKIRMLYNSNELHRIASSVNFAGASVLPSQGQSVISTGTAGGSNRRLDVFQGWPAPPPVFDYAIYSSTGLTK